MLSHRDLHEARTSGHHDWPVAGSLDAMKRRNTGFGEEKFRASGDSGKSKLLRIGILVPVLVPGTFHFLRVLLMCLDPNSRCVAQRGGCESPGYTTAAGRAEKTVE